MRAVHDQDLALVAAVGQAADRVVQGVHHRIGRRHAAGRREHLPVGDHLGLQPEERDLAGDDRADLDLLGADFTLGRSPCEDRGG